MNGEHIAEHFGRAARPSPDSTSSDGQVQSLSVNVIYTEPEGTAAALRAAESLARDLEATIHVRAMVCVPQRLPINCSNISISFLERLLCELVERFGSATCKYVVHIYVCRSRIDTLLRVLRPSSLLVIGGRRKLWPTAASRLAKTVSGAGHIVAFADLKAR